MQAVVTVALTSKVLEVVAGKAENGQRATAATGKGVKQGVALMGP